MSFIERFFRTALTIAEQKGTEDQQIDMGGGSSGYESSIRRA